MSYNKVNIFYPFDKGFFGKTLGTVNNYKVNKPSNLKMDSVDDLLKHFSDKCKRVVLERNPKVDNFQPKKEASNLVDFPEMRIF